MKIYTKSGDKGKTSLLGGERVKKYDLRPEAYGTVDELNSFAGFLISLDIKQEHKTFLTEIQRKLFDIGVLLAVRKKVKFKTPEVTDDDIIEIENEIDKLNEELPELKSFILPGGSKEAAQAHICRSVCRRAERIVSELADKESLNENILKYLNRLSDYFFVLARKINYEKKQDETFVVF